MRSRSAVAASRRTSAAQSGSTAVPAADPTIRPNMVIAAALFARTRGDSAHAVFSVPADGTGERGGDDALQVDLPRDDAIELFRREQQRHHVDDQHLAAVEREVTEQGAGVGECQDQQTDQHAARHLPAGRPARPRGPEPGFGGV